MIVAVVFATAVGTCAAADLQKILSDGTVQRIRVEAWPSQANAAGTVLRHLTQFPDGAVTIRTIPGTEDAATESGAVLDIDPKDNSLVLVWVRDEGGIPEILMSRFRERAWGGPVTVPGARPGASDPRMAVTRDWIHLIWTEPSGGARVPWRGVYRHEDFSIAFGPEALPKNLDTSGGGGSGGDPVADWSQIYLGLHLPGSLPGNGTIHVWGIRDEPVPIGYHQGHPQPPGTTEVLDLDAGWFSGSLVYWFHDDARFCYRSCRKGVWNPFRWVVLDDQTSADAARIQMIEMLRRR